jgi:hypothetical protein
MPTRSTPAARGARPARPAAVRAHRSCGRRLQGRCRAGARRPADLRKRARRHPPDEGRPPRRHRAAAANADLAGPRRHPMSATSTPASWPTAMPSTTTSRRSSGRPRCSPRWPPRRPAERSAARTVYPTNRKRRGFCNPRVARPLPAARRGACGHESGSGPGGGSGGGSDSVRSRRAVCADKPGWSVRFAPGAARRPAWPRRWSAPAGVVSRAQP